MDRVIVTKAMVGICGMQVCAEKDATNDEILAVCNQDNPSGTTNGWSRVVRNIDKESWFTDETALPIQCESYPDRIHFLVIC